MNVGWMNKLYSNHNESHILTRLFFVSEEIGEQFASPSQEQTTGNKRVEGVGGKM